MYTGLLHLHNFLRWVILILLLVAIIKAFMGMNGKKPFTPGDRKIGLFLMIAAHITLLIGLYQWAVGPWGLQNILNEGFGNVMKNKTYRFFAVEHLVGMLVAITMITLGNSVSKKSLSDNDKHKKKLRYYLIALVFIIVSVPWPFKGEEIARPLFPGA